MMNLIVRIWKWLKSILIKEKRFRYLKAEELPDSLDADVIYLIGENTYLWSAAMICPCGCRETLHMNLLENVKPNWSVTTHADATLTLHPSIWRKVGCRSHFIIRKGYIDWCKNT